MLDIIVNWTCLCYVDSSPCTKVSTCLCYLDSSPCTKVSTCLGATALRFVGSIPLWLGLALAVIVTALACRYYHRESFDLPRHLKWLLPGLRGLAFFLGIMVLTGPILKHRNVIGELGRIDIYLDASQSMTMLDPHMSTARKLSIAENLGWVEADRIDKSLSRLATEVAALRTEVMGSLQQAELDDTKLESLRALMLDQLRGINRKLNLHPEGKVSFQIGERLLESLTQLGNMSEPMPTTELSSELAQICQQCRELESALQQAFDGEIRKLAESGQSGLQTALGMFAETPRWRRIEAGLLESQTHLLDELRTQHDVQVALLQGEERVLVTESVAAGRPANSITRLFPDEPHGAWTDLSLLGTGETDLSVAAMEENGMKGSRLVKSGPVSVHQGVDRLQRAIVLLSDGQHNLGSSPIQLARILGGQGTAIYPVVIGAEEQAADLAVVQVERPEMVFKKDRVRGAVIIRDRMPAGQPFVVQIAQDGEILWQEKLISDASGERRLEFEFGVEELLERIGPRFQTDVQQHALPLSFTASIPSLVTEAETTNNQRSFRLAVVTESYQLLILDGRSRWETRYLRNAFERDSQWDVDTVIAGATSDTPVLPRGEAADMFPASREALYDYDLIVLGEIVPELFQPHEINWIRDFVASRGGGVILIDGQRAILSNYVSTELASLFPVAWLPDAITTLPTTLQLTNAGAAAPALKLLPNEQQNREFWSSLPTPHTLTKVEALPGAEVLATVQVATEEHPAIVTRAVGAGRVLYFAFDETWRWRYKAADLYHQRLWNQFAKFVMPRPFGASDDYLSIDTGPVSYQTGETAAIRIQLRGVDGQPATGVSADALLWRDGRVVATVPLSADADVPGLYRGETGNLTPGDYEVSVRAAGFNEDVMHARGKFVVHPPESNEMQETAANFELLRNLAVASGGQFLLEEELSKLPELLQPLSQGRVVESETLIWQSYWWFWTIIGLLTLEWFLRKRAGLL